MELRLTVTSFVCMFPHEPTRTRAKSHMSALCTTGTEAETAEAAATPSMSDARFRAVRAQLDAEGVNIAEWARDRQFGESLVYSVLSGRLPCRRGKAHQVAVALGLKDGVPNAVQQLVAA